MLNIEINSVGIGLRPPHFEQISCKTPEVDWLEVHSENYFDLYGINRDYLRKISAHYAISCHGVGLSLGSTDPINVEHLSKLKQLTDEINPHFISEHLSWSSVEDQYFNDLLPIPYTEEALALFSTRILQVQDYLQRAILIENPSSYLSYHCSEIPEWEFLSLLSQHTDCGLLLDINNVFVSANNLGLDATHYLNMIPAKQVKEIHLAGHTEKTIDAKTLLIDTHSTTICEGVWKLYHHFIQQFKHQVPPTLIEWDCEIPEFRILQLEADKAKALINQFNNTSMCKKLDKQGVFDAT